jgi:hypothetical protein
VEKDVPRARVRERGREGKRDLCSHSHVHIRRLLQASLKRRPIVER